MLVTIKEESVGLHPNEVVVSIVTRDGIERLVVHKRSIHDGCLEIGFPISQDEDFYLIELPRETMRGYWRIWVRKSDLTESSERRVA